MSSLSSLSSQSSSPSVYRRSAVLWLFLVPAIGGFLFGYDIGATSYAVVQLASFSNGIDGGDDDSYSPSYSSSLSLKDAPMKTGWIVSSPSAGALLGTAFLMYIDGGGGSGSGGSSSSSNSNYNSKTSSSSFFTRIKSLLLAPIGRRTELRYAGILYAIGGLLQFLSAFIMDLPILQHVCSPFAVLSIGRWIYGAGIGFAMHGGPTYLAETTPASVRGMVVGGKEIAIVVGILAGYAMGYKFCTGTGTGTDGDDNPNGWAYVYVATLFGSVLMAGFSYAIPESARYLASQQNYQYQRRNDNDIDGDDDDDDNNEDEQGDNDDDETTKRISAEVLESLKFLWRPQQAQQEHRKLMDILRKQRRVLSIEQNNNNNNGGIMSLLTDPSVRPALTAGLGLVVLQQITGQPSVLSYATTILAKVPGLNANASVLLALFKVLATSISVVLVETRGRKTLLMIGCSLMFVSLMVLTFAFSDQIGQEEATATTTTTTTAHSSTTAPLDTRSMMTLLGMFTYIAGYQIGFGPITWLIMSEVFPQSIRGKAVALSVQTNFALNAVVQFLVPLFRQGIGMSKTFAVFGVLSAYSLYFVGTSVPETKGLTLEEIEERFAALALTTSTTTTTKREDLSSLDQRSYNPNGEGNDERLENMEEERMQLLSTS